MAAIKDLIDQVEDIALKKRLTEEFNRLTKEKKFGLVFEEHLPELTPLYKAEVRKGNMVAKRAEDLTDLWRVLSISDGQAECMNHSSGEISNIYMEELVVVARFGEPIFPSLVPVDSIQNASDDSPWHTLIEADNYHALQLLEYLYEGQVDCIYIDPPYNTGARDWKYNNNYVDSNDSWRHSKWLAMMKRRLSLAFRLLKPDGIMVITIDDNEIHHLRMLLEDASFRQIVELGIVCIRNNPGGRATANGFSVNHEYAIFIGKTGKAKPGRLERTAKQISRYDQFDEKGRFEWTNFRKHGAGSDRSDRKRQYYPIYASIEGSIRIPDMVWDRVEDKWDILELPRKEENVVWPIRIINNNLIEKVWSWGEERVKNNLTEFEAKEAKDVTIQIYKKERVPIEEGRLPITWWSDKLYSSNEYGQRFLSNIFLDNRLIFHYPKSPYAVADTLKAAAVGVKKNALVLDFFAGSGTTLNAVNILNEADGGKRCCLMVTNNEVSEDEAKELRSKGIFPGDDEWEKRGICQSITWHRTKYTIHGQRDDGSEIDGDYYTGNFIDIEKPRKFYHIGFTTNSNLTTIAKKKQIVNLIEGIPMSAIKRDSAFIVSEKEEHFASVLFDDTKTDEWLDALTDYEHIVDFYIVTEKTTVFNSIKASVNELMGSMIIQEEVKRPIKDGFAANIEYYRLDFLERNSVELGRQFREILPLLWLRSGAVGPRPQLQDNEPIPPILLPEKNPFAVLVDETQFADFAKALQTRKMVTHAYLVTDSEEAFQEMAEQLNVPYVIQLYRDYIENFMINKGGW